MEVFITKDIDKERYREFVHICQVVHKAYRVAEKKAKPGVAIRSLDMSARKTIRIA